MAPIKTYWWRDKPNFGDALAPHLLKRFAGIEAEWAAPAEARLTSIGSVLGNLPRGWDGIICGSGKLFEYAPLYLSRRVKILLLRGPLTARGLPYEVALGDPGILVNELVEPQPKKYDWGVLPHWGDETLVPKFNATLPRWAILLDAASYPLNVLKEIAQCRQIVTSSLHGVIAADAFGIPRQVEYADNLDGEGNEFKFRDYSASLGMPFEVGKMMEAPRSRVEQLQAAVKQAFCDLPVYLNYSIESLSKEHKHENTAKNRTRVTAIDGHDVPVRVH